MKENNLTHVEGTAKKSGSFSLTEEVKFMSPPLSLNSSTMVLAIPGSDPVK